MTRLFSLGFALLFLLQGCFGLGRRTVYHRMPEEHTDRYRLHMQGEIQASLPGGASLSGPYRIDALVDSFVARVFRDESLGLVLTLVDFDGQVGESPAEFLPSEEVLGKSLALRVRPSGEIYRVTGAEALTGPARRGPLWVPHLLSLAFRLPANSWEGEGGPEYHFTLTLPLTETARIDQAWKLAYVSAQAQACGSGDCIAFSWQAKISEVGFDTSSFRPAELRGQGEAKGSLLWRPGDARVVEQNYSWSLDRTLTFGGTPMTNRLSGEVNWELEEE